MRATAKQKKGIFNQSDFKNAVGTYYSSIDEDKTLSFCHLLGSWFSSKVVKCAHLVPRMLSGPELAYIFGVEQDDVLYNPRNGKCSFLYVFPLIFKRLTRLLTSPQV